MQVDLTDQERIFILNQLQTLKGGLLEQNIEQAAGIAKSIWGKLNPTPADPTSTLNRIDELLRSQRVSTYANGLKEVPNVKAE